LEPETIVGLALLAFCTLVLTGIAGANHATAHRDIRMFERLRTDVQKSGSCSFAVNKAIEANQSLEFKRYSNTLPVIGLFVSDKWDSVGFIDLEKTN
jgi:hypothetical protein